MGKFFLNGETHRVLFADSEWVDIKPEFSQADLDYITSAMMKANITGDIAKKPEAKMDFVFGKQATLERAIVGWSFTEDDKPVPVTPDNISNLRTKYRSQVLSEIDRLNSEAGSFAKN